MPGYSRISQALNFKEPEAHPHSDPGRNSELADPRLESRGSQANFRAGEAPLSSEHPTRLQAEGENQPVIHWKVFCQAGNAPLLGTLPSGTFHPG